MPTRIHCFAFFLFLMTDLICAGCQKEGFGIIVNSSLEEEELFFDSNCLTFPGLGIHQSMDIYKDDVFFVAASNNNLVCDIYNLHTSHLVRQVSLPFGEYSLPHANVSCFGKLFYSENSIAPVLYISSWNNGRQAFVFDFPNAGDKSQASLVQVIDPGRVSEEIIGGGYLDWVIDGDGGYLYSIAYHIKGSSQISEGNFTHIAKFQLPDLSKRIVDFTDADVIDSFTVPVMTIFQDKCFHDNYIYVVSGHSGLGKEFPPRLYAINTLSKEMNEALIPLVGEPEGFCWYQGRKWLNMYNSAIVYNLDLLINN